MLVPIAAFAVLVPSADILVTIVHHLSVDVFISGAIDDHRAVIANHDNGRHFDAGSADDDFSISIKYQSAKEPDATSLERFFSKAVQSRSSAPCRRSSLVGAHTEMAII